MSTFIEIRNSSDKQWFINRHLIVGFYPDASDQEYTFIQMHNGDEIYAHISLRSLQDKLK